MRKTNITTLLCITAFFTPMFTQMSTYAEELNIGDVVGQTVATDIMTYVNGKQIPAYSTNGETLVRIADLACYGFDVEFRDGISCADYNETKTVAPVSREQQPGLPILYTDIEVQINGVTVPGYNIDGYMAVPVERMCEAYQQTDPPVYKINYIWSNYEKALYIDVASDRVAYQDLMLSLLKAAKMDQESSFYEHYVKTDNIELNNLLAGKLSDVEGSATEPNIYLLSKADLIDINTYADGDRIHPYRSSTMTDAAFLISRILGCPSDYQAAIDYFCTLYPQDANAIAQQNVTIVPDYKSCEINAADASLIPSWSRQYFAYLLDIGVFKTDENGCINPYEFLTSDSLQSLTDAMLKYMERGITDIDIDLSGYQYYSDCFFNQLTKVPHKLTSPAQIIDNVLYIPWYSVFNNSYNSDIENVDPSYNIDACKYIATETPTKLFNECSTPIFNNHYVYTGAYGYIFHVFPGMSGYIYQRKSYGYGEGYVPYYTDAKYPILKLYGEPMVPVYDYSTGQDLMTDCPYMEFDPDTCTLQIAYPESSRSSG